MITGPWGGSNNDYDVYNNYTENRPSKGLQRSRSDRGVHKVGSYSGPDPPPAPIHYRGIRSLKHKHDKTYFHDNGMKKSSSLHDLSAPDNRHDDDVEDDEHDEVDGTADVVKRSYRARSKSGDRLGGEVYRRRTVSRDLSAVIHNNTSSTSPATVIGSEASHSCANFQENSSELNGAHHLDGNSINSSCDCKPNSVTAKTTIETVSTKSELQHPDAINFHCSNALSKPNRYSKLVSLRTTKPIDTDSGSNDISQSRKSRRDHPNRAVKEPSPGQVPGDLAGISLKNKVAHCVSMWENLSKSAMEGGLTLFGYSALGQKQQVRPRPRSAPAVSSHTPANRTQYRGLSGNRHMDSNSSQMHEPQSNNAWLSKIVTPMTRRVDVKSENGLLTTSCTSSCSNPFTSTSSLTPACSSLVCCGSRNINSSKQTLNSNFIANGNVKLDLNDSPTRSDSLNFAQVTDDCCNSIFSLKHKNYDECGQTDTVSSSNIISMKNNLTIELNDQIKKIKPDSLHCDGNNNSTSVKASSKLEGYKTSTTEPYSANLLRNNHSNIVVVPDWVIQDPHPVVLPPNESQGPTAAERRHMYSSSHSLGGASNQEGHDQDGSVSVDVIEDSDDGEGHHGGDEDLTYRSRSPTSSLLLNGKNKNETDERKVRQMFIF